MVAAAAELADAEVMRSLQQVLVVTRHVGRLDYVDLTSL